MESPAVDLDKIIFWINHQETHPHDMTWFAVNFVYFMLLLVLAAKILESVIFPAFLPNYHEHSIRSIRNLVTYVLEVVVTSFCFYLTATYGIKVYLEKHNYHDIEMSRMNLGILCCLYLFELMYRLEMNFQLTFHHVLTLVFCILGVQGAFDTRDSKYVAAGVLLSLTANTEQLSFIALFMYRIKHKYAGYALRFSAIQTFFCKAMFTALLLDDALKTIYGHHQQNPNGSMWYQYWKILIPVLVPGLFIVQVYGAFVMWKIGASKSLRCDSPREEKKFEDVPVVKHLKHA